jgi:hypothetical protein
MSAGKHCSGLALCGVDRLDVWNRWKLEERGARRKNLVNQYVNIVAIFDHVLVQSGIARQQHRSAVVVDAIAVSWLDPMIDFVTFTPFFS